MNMFSPHYYFDLEGIPFKELFDGCSFAWEALKGLAPYLEAQDLGKMEGEVSPQAYLINPETISIGKGTIVEAGAYIKGPCVIGENCQIRHGCYIRGNTLVGDKAVVGHATEVKNSIFFPGAQAGHFAYVGDSILGRKVNLGAGTKCANLRLDGQEVVLPCIGKSFPTSLRKFGLIAGDYASLGCNSVSNPGTLIGKEVFTYPCTNFGGVIPEKTRVKKNKIYWLTHETTCSS